MNNIKKLCKAIRVGDRHGNRILLFVIFLSFVLAAGNSVLLSSMKETERQERYDRYGQWQGAVKDVGAVTINAIQAHLSVKASGVVKKYAETWNQSPTHLNLGTLDEKAIELSRIELFAGNFPRAAGEIALEKQCLSYLGYSYDIGQTVVLQIQYADKTGQEVVEERSFILSGIVKSYSANWTLLRNDTLNGFLADDDELCSLIVPNTTLLFLGSYNENTIKELRPLLGLGEMIIYNRNAYPYFSWNEFNVFSSQIGDGLVYLIVFLLVFGAFAATLNGQKHQLNVMDLCGASKSQLKQVLFYKSLYIFSRTALCGILTGILISSAIILILQHCLNSQIYYKLHIINLLVSIFIVTVSILLACMWPLVMLNQYIKGAAAPKRVKAPHTMKPISLKSLTRSLAVRKIRFNQSNIQFQFFTFFAMSFVLFALFFSFLEAYTDYRRLSIANDVDYIWSTPYPELGLDSETVQHIENTEGIESVDSLIRIVIKGNVDIAGEGTPGENEFPYKSFLSEGSSNLQVEIIACDSDSDYFEYMKKEIDEGGMTREDFDNGEAIVLLPPLAKFGDEQYYGLSLEKWMEYRWLDRKCVMNEETLSPGKTLELTGAQAEIAKWRVAAIIRGFDTNHTNMRITIGGAPYTLIVSKKYLEQISGDSLSYNWVSASVKDKDVPETTDTLMSRITDQKGQYFSNVREENEKFKRIHYNRLKLLIMLGTFIFLFGWMAIMNTNNAFLRKEKKYIDYMCCLGASQKHILKIYSYSSCYVSMIGLSLALLVNSLGYYLPNIAVNVLFEEYRYPILFAMEIVWEHKNEYFPMVLFLAFCILMVLLLPISNYVQIKKQMLR